MTGNGLPPAAVDFGDGLTLITGLSNTGKSHVLECIDFALGGSAPSEFPEAAGYTLVALEVGVDEGPHTIIRSLNDTEQATVFAGALDDWDGAAGEVLKVQISPKKPRTTLSGWLLEQSGFDPESVILKNLRAQSQALSFRTIAPLVMVREPDMISEGSPVLPASYTQHTSARSAFAILLTGKAPTAEELSALQEAHSAREQASQRVGLLDGIIAELRVEIADADVDRRSLEQELSSIDQELAEVSAVVAASGARVRTLIEARNKALSEADNLRRRALNAQELTARFDLLSTHYAADIKRLEFALEGGHFFDQIAASHCPRCGRPLGPDELCHPESAEFGAIERAARAEIKKLQPRIRDLVEARSDASTDEDEARRAEARHLEDARKMDAEIAQIANPTAQSARARVEQITGRRREVEASLLRFRELDRYLAVRSQALSTAQKKVDGVRVDQDVASLQRLSAQIQAVLEEWRFPVRSDVSYDAAAADIVIDGKSRGANGKGVRAVTHAAFTIGLMRYCLEDDRPHPGFVVIDTPLTHFRGETDDIDDPELTRDLHAAFLYSLTFDEGVGQSIIIENVDPPSAIAPRAKIHEFGSEVSGRAGFYPRLTDAP